MSAGQPVRGSAHGDVIELIPLIRRVIAARVRNAQVVDDLVQEALTRVMTARHRMERETLAPYAAVVARNLVVSLADRDNRDKRHAHRLVDLRHPDVPEEEILRREESQASPKRSPGCLDRNARRSSPMRWRVRTWPRLPRTCGRLLGRSPPG